VVTVDEIRNRPLTLTTRVNGQQRQHATSSEMLFDFGQVVEHISTYVEFVPGDVILTGTPAGVVSLMVGICRPATSSRSKLS